jgi:glycosyltransferase involved in cell wall biosynthesis
MLSGGTSLNIAFHSMGNEQWMAGRTVLDAFFHALKETSPDSIKRSLTVWDNQPPESIPYGLDLVDEIISLPSQPGQGFSLTEYLTQHGADVFFSLPIQTALQIELPRIVWIYDFQHVHHPELLPPQEVERRNRLFKQNAQTASLIVVTAQTVADDLAVFAPECADKTVVLSIVPWIPAEAFGRARPPGPAHDKFFFLPNHFLRHKNHGVVLQALRLLKERGLAAKVVCTGNTDDGQGDLYYKELIRQCHEWGLEENFVVLGLVPREQFYELLGRCVAVINPSRFEGFGLSVAEARFLGTPALLSDLPVLREHGHPAAQYFPPTDSEALTELMEAAWKKESAPRNPNRLQQDYQAAQRQFAEKFLKIARKIQAL